MALLYPVVVAFSVILSLIAGDDFTGPTVNSTDLCNNVSQLAKSRKSVLKFLAGRHGIFNKRSCPSGNSCPFMTAASTTAGRNMSCTAGCLLWCCCPPPSRKRKPLRGYDFSINLGQHRTIRQEPVARDFSSAESLENRGILGVFPVFQTARMRENTRHPAADAIVRCCLR